MKKSLFLLASVAMLMLAGCGESGGATSATNNPSNNVGGNTPEENDVPTTVGADEVAATTPHNLYKINDKLGTPPALPGN